MKPFGVKKSGLVPLGILTVPLLVVISYLTYLSAICHNRGERGFARIMVTFLIETLNSA